MAARWISINDHDMISLTYPFHVRVAHKTRENHQIIARPPPGQTVAFPESAVNCARTGLCLARSGLGVSPHPSPLAGLAHKRDMAMLGVITVSPFVGCRVLISIDDEI